MRRTLLLLCIVGLACSSWAAAKLQPVTVAQLGQYLAGAQGQPDAKVAGDLEGMVLSERVPVRQLTDWLSKLPGRHSRDALTALADVAIVLPLPAADVLADPPPDIHAQGAIVSSAIDYVVQTLAKMPDFSATRTTEHFEDRPVTVTGALSFGEDPNLANVPEVNNSFRDVSGVTQVVAARPLYPTGQSTEQVGYRNGVEMRGAQKMDASTINQAAPGLSTAGEFGPILTIVLRDALHGSIRWGYWEQGPAGKLAVFRYTVADGKSSFALALKHGIRKDQVFPAYQGEIAIDPATGAILRITLVANSLRSQYVVLGAMAVDYGVIQLGGKDYNCPLKGVALLETFPDSAGLQTQVNDATFTGYQLGYGEVNTPPRAHH